MKFAPTVRQARAIHRIALTELLIRRVPVAAVAEEEPEAAVDVLAEGIALADRGATA